MSYDPEKYRKKREKVLGIRKRGLGFGTIATVVAFVIVLGLSMVTVPQAVSFVVTRHLDDAIFNLETGTLWPREVLSSVNSIEGVKGLLSSKHHTRLVVTFDRRIVNTGKIESVFDQYHLSAALLNQLNHRQHQATMKQEEEELETQ